MVTTGRPAGPPGWEQAQPVNRQAAAATAGATRAGPAAARPAPLPGRPGAARARPVPDSESDWDAARLGHGP